METLQIQDVNTTFSRFALLFETTLNKHASFKVMSRKQQRIHRIVDLTFRITTCRSLLAIAFRT